MGYACYLLGRYDDATVYWQQGLDLYRKGGDQAGVAVGIQGIGLLQTAQGEWDAALASFLNSLDASRKLGLKEPTASQRYARALLRLKDMLQDLVEARGET